MDKNLKTILIIGGIIVGVLAILSIVPGILWGGQYGSWGMMGPGMMGGYGTMFLMPILWIVVLGLIIWAVVAAVRPGESSRSDSGTSSALEVLKKRYARGEIDKEEFEEKKKDLI
ncbi:MAG: SHOCT domain-containing protein [Dehalococcoidales bacterium]|nr:SHOCT domain-containing protein [Dehalococcoidales bacterium]